MRALLLSALVATTAFADTAPPSPPPSPPGTPRPLPRPGTAAWRRVDRTIADHCRSTHDPACACVLDALRARPPLVVPEWDRGRLVFSSNAMDAVIGATLAPRGRDDWLVLKLECTSLLTPRF